MPQVLLLFRNSCQIFCYRHYFAQYSLGTHLNVAVRYIVCSLYVIMQKIALKKSFHCAHSLQSCQPQSKIPYI